MIVLGGFSRFPIFFNGNGQKTIGFESNNTAFNDYIGNLKGKFVVFTTFSDIQYRRRFVVDGMAINPELKGTEPVPRSMYVYPDVTPTKTFMNTLAKGIIVKGGRGKVFIPLLPQRELEGKEIKALLGITEVKEFGMARMKVFLERIDINFNIVRELSNQRIVLNISDRYINDSYQLLINHQGRVLDTDFCIHNYRNLYLPEMVMFIRESGGVHHVGGFDY